MELVTNTVTKTVYSADNVVGETAATDMLTVFEVQVNTTQTRHSQLAIYVSEGTVIRNVDVQNQHCNSTSKLGVQSFVQTYATAGIRKPLGLFAPLKITTSPHYNLFRHTECNVLGRYTFHRTYFYCTL